MFFFLNEFCSRAWFVCFDPDHHNLSACVTCWFLGVIPEHALGISFLTIFIQEHVLFV